MVLFQGASDSLRIGHDDVLSHGNPFYLCYGLPNGPSSFCKVAGMVAMVAMVAMVPSHTTR